MADVLVEPVPCLGDNYAYLLIDGEAGEAWVVDPSELTPLAAALERHPGVRLAGVLATHHHPDHVGAATSLLRRVAAHLPVAGHEVDRGRIPGQTVYLAPPAGRLMESGLSLGGTPLLVMSVPGHTRGGLAWCLPSPAGEPAHVFTGDTLFAAGCGRLFEGTPEEMFDSLLALMELPDPTHLWFGHEYTESNLLFARTVEPDNEAIAARLDALPDTTTPTTVAEEKATNPFVRAKDVEEFAERRAAKDRA